jgi:DNA-binding transcriptional MerR regulator
MDDMLDIGDVARLTGLTLRALRFYEGRGLVKPLRTGGGRRVYGHGELARLNAAVALKRAGFSLAQIGAMLGGKQVDLGRLIAAQIAEVDAQSAALAESRTLLLTVQSRIDLGEPIDVATLCSLIRNGENIMESEQWRGVVDQYFTQGEQREFSSAMTKVPAEFNQDEYSAKWRDIGARIEAALPLDPLSQPAQAFVDEWFALLKPFTEVATPTMWQGTARMYDDMPNWKSNPDMGFGPEVWAFIKTAAKARIDAGGTVDGPAWMTGAPK